MLVKIYQRLQFFRTNRSGFFSLHGNLSMYILTPDKFSKEVLTVVFPGFYFTVETFAISVFI